MAYANVYMVIMKISVGKVRSTQELGVFAVCVPLGAWLAIRQRSLSAAAPATPRQRATSPSRLLSQTPRRPARLLPCRVARGGGCPTANPYDHLDDLKKVLIKRQQNAHITFIFQARAASPHVLTE